MLRPGVHILTFLLVAAIAASVGVSAAQPGAVRSQPAARAVAAPSGSQPPAEEGKEAHEEGPVAIVARLVNFAMLAGILVYFLKAPVGAYLESRSVQIRQDLVRAAEMRHAASAELEEIDRKMKALPGELDQLRARGAEDVRAEQERIARAAAADRERLIDQTRREIDMHLRITRRELTELAARLAVQVARERITKTITPADQLHLLDRYTAQLQEAR